ncbi:hypothetical protein PLICRDRAFT_47292 [Plicaturopsis crispa FD-325 SS-3]|uniref:AB hydrolase-1 domain-containing protein n=1 Tax=Plicaturopsis crispa FD-325 SS-3 TaxID=944288 RepID=A0A0C9T5M4_PLICR|nr:hypothetical protein PLICRDRAFT_47292 [Plicaturopsis crispa FD-325 SS-3]
MTRLLPFLSLVLSLFFPAFAISAFNPRTAPKSVATCPALNRALNKSVDIRIQYYDVNPSAPQTLLLVHGWPSLASSWARQIDEFSPREIDGVESPTTYRVLAPDMRGFGGSTHPGDVNASNTMGDLVGDLACVLQHAGINANDENGVGKKANVEKGGVICVGHDWGAQTCYEMARMRPDLVKGVVGVTVPYIPPTPPYTPIRSLIPLLPKLAYQLYFDSRPLDAARELDNDTRRTLRATLRSVESKPPDAFLRDKDSLLGGWAEVKEIPPVPFLSPDEEDFFVEQYKVQGFGSTLGWYMDANRRASWALAQAQGNMTIPQPVLSILPLQDPVADWAEAARILKSAEYVPELTTVMLNGAHWVHLENPDETNKAMRRWLDAHAGRWLDAYAGRWGASAKKEGASTAAKGVADVAETAKSAVKGASTTAKDAANVARAATETLKGAVEGATNVVDGAKETVKGATKAAKSAVAGAGEAAGTVKSAVKSAVGSAKSAAEGATETAKSAAVAAESVVEGATEMAKSAAEGAAEAAGTVKSAGKRAGETVKTAVHSATDVAGSAVKGAAQAAGTVKSAGKRAGETVKSAAGVAESAVEGAMEMAKSATEAAESSVEGATETAKRAGEAVRSAAVAAESVAQGAAEHAQPLVEHASRMGDNTGSWLAQHARPWVAALLGRWAGRPSAKDGEASEDRVKSDQSENTSAEIQSTSAASEHPATQTPDTSVQAEDKSENMSAEIQSTSAASEHPSAQTHDTSTPSESMSAQSPNTSQDAPAPDPDTSEPTSPAHEEL